jgi:tetratricopeptide (TPR) repeat protein
MAAYTGARVIGRDKDPKDHVHYGDYSGSIQGKNYSVQGNTLASPEVLKAMAAAWENTKGSMGERLLAALEGGQSKGGDSRGMQSGGIIVVQPVADLAASLQADRVVDIRVDDSDDPFKEMRRILNVRLSGNHTTKAADLAKQGKLADAIAEQKIALQMNPKNEQINYMLAVYYAQSGDSKNALPALTAALKKQPRLKMDVVEEPAFDKLKNTPEFKRLIEK